MGNSLDDINVATIQDRSNETSFARGQGYYAGGAVQQRLRNEDEIEARVSGSSSYRVIVRGGAAGLVAFCTCPYDWGGDCKHIVATLLAWVKEPESFEAVSELKVALAARPQEELASILADICVAYPHLVDEFALLGDLTTFDPKAAVAKIFSELHPPGEISMDEAVMRMENVARQAARLAENGQDTLARQTYYELTDSCVSFCDNYGAHDIFPDHIPFDFADAYRYLALEQIDEQSDIILREVNSMLESDWAPEVLGIDDPLNDVWSTIEYPEDA